MRVKVGHKIYDGNDVPVMIIMKTEDKENIKNMHPDATKYCSYPESMTAEEAQEWMTTE